MAQRIGSSQLRQIALFTPRFVDDKLENFIVVCCCFLIEFDGEWLWSEASVELSDDSRVVVVVVLVLIDVFFNDDFRDVLLEGFDEVYISDVSISNSD